MTHIQTIDAGKAPSRTGAFLIAAALLAMLVATPASARTISFNGFSFTDKEPLIEQLIELDADDIEDLRAEFAEARADIADAVRDIEDARRDVEGIGEAALRGALKVAARAVEKAADKAFAEALSEIDRAERDLADADVDGAERAETQRAIDMLREEIAGLEAALADLAAAMRA